MNVSTPIYRLPAPVALCSAIPPHILRHAAEHGDENARATLNTTLQYSALIAGRRKHGLFAVPQSSGTAKKRRNVYTARGRRDLPGQLVMSENQHHASLDSEAIEAFNGCGATYDFYATIFDRHSIDDRGMSIDSTIHYGRQFDNALWNGQQMIYGDGDGTLFNRFTSSIEVIAHELTHGVTQYTARLVYDGQSGALSEHLSDAFGIMVKQHALGQAANDSNWLIGAELLAKGIRGKAVRSMAAPGTAYDDPVLGQDPQVASMKDYDDSPEDNGGVHVNSGIPNRAFYLAAVAIGGNSWDVVGRIWYEVLSTRLSSSAQFQDFAEATVAEAGELYGQGSKVQNIVAQAWSEVGLPVFTGPKRALPAMIVVSNEMRQAIDPFTSNPDAEKCAIHLPKCAVHCPKCSCQSDDFKAGKDLSNVVHAPKWPWKRKDPHHYYDFQQTPRRNALTRRKRRGLQKHLRRLAKHRRNQL